MVWVPGGTFLMGSEDFCPEERPVQHASVSGFLMDEHPVTVADMAGNVWEWTSNYFTPRHPDDAMDSCCVPSNPRVDSAEQSYDLGQPGEHIPRRVVKGGSHLCAPN
jgi:formylglycine-generating enzyme required for sulfatase activity